MKLNELFNVMNHNQFIDVYYEGRNGELIKCASYNNNESIDEKFHESEVKGIRVTKYNTFDILIEKVEMNKRYRVKFSINDWVDLEEEVELEFEDGEDEGDRDEAVSEAFRDWLSDKINELRDESGFEVIEVEEYL